MAEERSKTQLGIAAAKAGQHEQAREWFIAALQENEQDINAWLWLSQVVETDQDRLDCIEQVLRLNPSHPLGLKAQVVLRARLAANTPTSTESAPFAGEQRLDDQVESQMDEEHIQSEAVLQPEGSVQPAMVNQPEGSDQPEPIDVDIPASSTASDAVPESASVFLPFQPGSTAVPPLTENTPLTGKIKKTEKNSRVRHVGPFTILPPELAGQPEFQQETVIVLSPLAIVFLIILGVLLLVMVMLAGSLLIFAPHTFWQNLADFFGGLWGIIRG